VCSAGLREGSPTRRWLSNILDKFAAPHAAKWGCYWNRDIPQIVRDAGLEIVESRTFHFGTTHYIVAKPMAGLDPAP